MNALQEIGSVLGLISTFLTIVAWIIVWVAKPWGESKQKVSKRFDRLEQKIAVHDIQLMEIQERLKEDDDSLKEQQRLNALTLRFLMTLGSHELDGNHTEQLKACIEEIKRELYRKGGIL